MNRLKPMIIVMLILLSALAGCVGSDDQGEDSAPSTGENIPPLTAPNQHGDNVTLSNMDGTMLVILINMGEWCSYCIQATENATALIQEMEDIDDRYNISFVEILGSNETWEAANQTYSLNWSTKYNSTHYILHSQVSNDYAKDNIDEGFPTYWIVDPEGILRVVSPGVNTISAEDVQEQYDLFISEK